MSAAAIKSAMKGLLLQSTALFPATHVFTEYPRVMPQQTSAIIFDMEAPEKRLAGPVGGTKQVIRKMVTLVMYYGDAGDGSDNSFTALLDSVAQRYRDNSLLAAGNTSNSRVIRFGEDQDVVRIKPQAQRQFILYQANITNYVYDAIND